MGRKRVKQDVEEALRLAEKVHKLELKDEDNLYPFSLTWQWTAQNGKKKGELIRLAVDATFATQQEAHWNETSPHRFFYSEFKAEFPWAVNALARGLKTACINSRWSISVATTSRRAIGEFLSYCRAEEVRLDSADDLNFLLLCRWRNSLRLSPKQSRYKALNFRAFTRIVELLLGTSLMPKVYTLPIYLSDNYDPVLPYSDVVMYQLISACVADTDQIMREAEWLRRVQLDGSLPVGITKEAQCESWTDVVKNYVGKFSYRYSDRGITSVHTAKERASVSRDLARLGESDPDEAVEFLTNVKFTCPETSPIPSWPFTRLLEKEVATRGSLFPFLLLFMMLSGKNKETVMTWQRLYKINGVNLTPLEWKDPFDEGTCRIRGFKTRGKGRGKFELEDTYIKIEEDGIYPLLKFVLWYTDPLKDLVESRYRDSLWLYQSKTKVIYMDVSERFIFAASAFMQRHEIWDYTNDENNRLVKTRLVSLDTRRFRKVFASRELLKAIGQCSSYEELCAALLHALNHKEFDTTFGSYLGLGAKKEITDIGIFALQTKYLEEARTFRGEVNPIAVEGLTPGLYTSCANPQSPDYEGVYSEGECHEFDMCLGCTQSRVFQVHLPRIAMRVLQYEELRPGMSSEAWEAGYGRKHARAMDVLARWEDQTAVEDAWSAAREGHVALPDLIFRG